MSKNVLTLKSGSKVTQGIIRYIVYGFLLVFFSDFVPKMHRFLDVRLEKCRDLENLVRGPSRSFLRYSMSKNVVTLKSESEVTQCY